MQVSGQLYTPATLPPEKSHQRHFDRIFGGPKSRPKGDL